MEDYSNLHKSLWELKLVNKLLVVFILVMKELCVQLIILAPTDIKVLVFGHLTNLLIDMQIKIIKLPVISLELHHLIKLHGKWDGLLDLILKTQIVQNSQLINNHLNLTKVWLIVLKILDPLWLTKFKVFLMEPYQFPVVIVLLLLGFLVECVQMVLFYKE